MAERPVSAIRNLGAAMEAAFAKAGITTAEELEALGADAAYASLIATGHRPHILAFQAVALGLEGRHWNSADSAEKAALRTRYEAIRAGKPATASGRSKSVSTSLEAELDRLGLGRR
ncbi:MAG: TfoX/Sxy family DNA transformation protein [Pseudomonadota bacterium]